YFDPNTSNFASAGFTKGTTNVSLDAHIYLVVKTQPFSSNSYADEGNNISFFASSKFHLDQLEGSFRGTLISSGDTDNSCDPYHADFTILQPAANFISLPPPGAPNSISTCADYEVDLRFSQIGALYPNEPDFPNEFRPYAQVGNAITLNVPTGYRLTSSTYIVPVDDYDASGTNNFIAANTNAFKTYSMNATQTGNTINISSPSGCWPLFDCKQGNNINAAYYQLHFQPACKASSGTFALSYSLTNSVQQTDPGVKDPNNFLASYQQTQTTTNQNSYPVNTVHSTPVLTVNPPSATVVGNTVTFNIVVCNNSGNVAYNSWIDLQQLNGFLNFPATVTVTGLGSVLVVLTENTTDCMVPIGDVPIGGCITITIVATVNSSICTYLSGQGSSYSANYSVLAGVNCDGTDAVSLSNLTCQQSSTPSTFLINNSALTLVGQGVNPVVTGSGLCNSKITYNMLLTSSDLGDVNDPYLNVTLPAGLTLDGVTGMTLNYPYGSANFYTTLSDHYGHTFGSLAFELDQDLGVSGFLNTPPNTTVFPGTHALSNKNEVGISITFDASCSYTNSTVPFSANGTGSCNGPVSTANYTGPASSISGTCPSVTIINVFNAECVPGKATASVSGGTPAYSYSWTDGETNATATNLTAGSYTVTITDANGCSATASVTIVQNSLTTSITVNSNVSCHGGNNGSLTANPSGGTSPYTYNWSPGSKTSQTITGLIAGSYTVIVHDANGCSVTASVTITQPAAALAASISNELGPC